MNRIVILIIVALVPAILFAQDINFMDGTTSSVKKGDRYFNEYHYNTAITYYQKALMASPGDDAVELKMARCYTKLNDSKQAARYYEGAIGSKLTSDEDILNYAEALSANGEYEAAIKWYDKYYTTHPQDHHIARKKEGLEHVEIYYQDSVAYFIKQAPFNSSKADFSPMFLNDEILFVSGRGDKSVFRFTDARTGDKFLDIYRYQNGTVSRFEALKGRLHEGPLTMFAGGKKAIATVNQRESLKNNQEHIAARLKLAIYNCPGGTWKYESDFPYNSDAYSVYHPSFDEKSQILYFSSDMPGGKGGADLYRSDYRDGKWSAPVNLQAINTPGDEMFPFISSNGDLYFASNGLPGLGALDIYSVRINEGQAVAYNLGYPVNTSGDDFGLALDSTERHGYISSNRLPGNGDDNIYALTIFRMKVEASLKDKDSGAPIDGNIQVEDTRTGREVPCALTGGKAVFEALKGRTYKIIVKKEGYADFVREFRADDGERSAIDVSMARIPEVDTRKAGMGEKIVSMDIVRIINLTESVVYEILPHGQLKEVADAALTSGNVTFEIKDLYFQFDATRLLSGDEELTMLATLLNKYNDIELEIIAYCDGFGSREYNDKLAGKRIQMVIDRLTQRGIKQDRLQYVIVGSRNLFNKCANPGNCSVEQNRQNRRIEFKLVQTTGNTTKNKFNPGSL